MTPRGAIRVVIGEMAELRRSLLSKSQMPAVRQLESWERLLLHALGERATGETPTVVDLPTIAAASDPDKPKSP